MVVSLTPDLELSIILEGVLNLIPFPISLLTLPGENATLLFPDFILVEEA